MSYTLMNYLTFGLAIVGGCVTVAAFVLAMFVLLVKIVDKALALSRMSGLMIQWAFVHGDAKEMIGYLMRHNDLLEDDNKNATTRERDLQDAMRGAFKVEQDERGHICSISKIKTGLVHGVDSPQSMAWTPPSPLQNLSHGLLTRRSQLGRLRSHLRVFERHNLLGATGKRMRRDELDGVAPRPSTRWRGRPPSPAGMNPGTRFHRRKGV